MIQTELGDGIASSSSSHPKAIMIFMAARSRQSRRERRSRSYQCNLARLCGFKHPSKYDPQFLLKPNSKANIKLILAEEGNIKHVFASLATKVTSQGVIIGELSSYARRNRTEKALRELDNLHRSRCLLSYIDSLRLRRNVQRVRDRGESYHKLVRVVAYANAGKLRVRTDLEQQLWSECSRLLANCVIYYNACVLSQLLEYGESEKDTNWPIASSGSVP
jgi:TnpA family transposase